MRPGVFLDRDGTLIEHVHHLTDPADVRPIEGAADAVRKLRAAGYAVVVVTNQSVIGRGMLTVAGLARVHEPLHRHLAERGTKVDGVYFCPVAPTQGDPTVIEHADRKPGPGMLRRAARDLSIDVSRSWMIGDTISDMLAGRNAGCMRSVLVQTGPDWDQAQQAADHVVENLKAAATLILAAAEAAYEPTAREPARTGRLRP